MTPSLPPYLLVAVEKSDRTVSETGRDKTFYFVGADAFRQKFRPKQRESDATKNLKNSGNSTLNKLNLLYESLYESLDFYFLLLFKQSFPLDKSIFSILAIQFLLVNDFFPWKVNFFLERKFL